MLTWLMASRTQAVAEGITVQAAEWLLSALSEMSSSSGKGLKTILGELVGGKLKEDPFPKDMVADLRKKLGSELSQLFPDMAVDKLPGDRE